MSMTPEQHGRETFLRGKRCIPGLDGQRILGHYPDNEWMERYSRGWHEANVKAPVCMPDKHTTTGVLNRAGMRPAFVQMTEEPTLVDAREILGGIIELIEEVPAYIARLGGTAAGTTIGPFVREESAAEHGTPRKVIVQRRRYVQNGHVSPGSPSRMQLDENDPTTIVARSLETVAH